MPGARKYVHLRIGEESLEVKCLRDGTLDCDLETGEVFSVKNGQRIKRSLFKDADGYLFFTLNRERSKKAGKPERDLRGKLRYRHRRSVLVHRLVKIKAIAYGKGGENWREFVTDLPRGVDVNHLGERDDNRQHKLELQSEAANRAKRKMTNEEWAELQATF